MKKIITIFVVLLLVFSVFSACNKKPIGDLWENAIYKENTSLGKGSKTFVFDIYVNDNKVSLTVSTDRETVGDALFELGLIDGDNGPYGLYVKKVNGITADYDIDKTYWSFEINNETAMTGVDGEIINESNLYAMRYIK